MTREEIQTELQRDPFTPFRLRLVKGKKLDVPFPHVIVFRKTGIIIFKGVKKPGSHVATGFEVIEFDQISGIERRRSRGGGGARRRKAS
jgi:hypothetical protein